MPRLTPQYASARHWKTDRRFEEAVKKVLDEQWTHAKAAEWYGVSRPRLTSKVGEERRAREHKADQLAQGVSAAALSPLGLQERRRVPATFAEFDEYYFGRWICPDCRVHHPTPDFHIQIGDLLEDPAVHRGLINMPPYHAKSTTVTIKNTIYKIVQDPNWRRLIVSKSHKFAETFLVSISELLTNRDLYAGGPDLIEDWGPFQPTGDKKNNIWNAQQIYVAGRVTAEKDPTVQVLGVGGQVYGRRADDIVCDDIATLENQKNPDRVKNMLEWLDKELSSRTGRNGKLVYVGTRVAPGDIYSTLASRPNMHVLRFACISDEAEQTTLWPDHFPYEAAVEKREEMLERDWQLVYQNVDIPGLGASFVEESINQCKDGSRVLGHHLPGWRLIAGLDPAGGNKDSGYTALFLMAVDLQTGMRYPVDIVNVKSMRAPQLKDAIFDWADKYPLYSFRVETNGLQSQLVQYNDEIIKYLAQKGIRVEPHNTGKNKWDPQFGVESMAPLFNAQMVSIPWGNAQTARAFQPWVEQLLAFPMGSVNDTVMASWFADLGVRDLLRRAHLPMFDTRAKVPERIRRKRVVVDFEQREVRKVPAHAQAGAVTTNERGFRRLTAGRPMPHRSLGDPAPPEETPFVNVEGTVEAASA